MNKIFKNSTHYTFDPVKRIIQDARERGSLIDASYGRKTRSVIIAESNHIILSSVQPETIAGRIDENSGEVFENGR